jgi:hypothetical protein
VRANEINAFNSIPITWKFPSGKKSVATADPRRKREICAFAKMGERLARGRRK